MIPVGPKSGHKKYLAECIESILNQIKRPDEILILDDQAHLKILDRPDVGKLFVEDAEFPRLSYRTPEINIWDSPWLSGPTTMFNYGVALAKNEWVAFLGSDDKLYPTALEKAEKAIEAAADPNGYYNFSCFIDENQSVVSWFNHASVVSKSLWKLTGGLHPMSITGAMDAAFISVLMKHMPEHLHKIAEGEPLYWVRSHPDQYTLESTSRYGTFVIQLRDDLTREWKKPEWTKGWKTPSEDWKNG